MTAIEVSVWVFSISFLAKGQLNTGRRVKAIDDQAYANRAAGFSQSDRSNDQT